jgi:hypothetical protein
VEEACGQWRRRVASGGGVWPVEEACGQWRRRVASGGGVWPVFITLISCIAAGIGCLAN